MLYFYIYIRTHPVHITGIRCDNCWCKQPLLAPSSGFLWQWNDFWFSVVSFLCLYYRSFSMRTAITTSTASVVFAVIALWPMSRSPARMMPCSATTVTVTSSPLNVWPATRSSCQVKGHGRFDLAAESLKLIPFVSSISVFPRCEILPWKQSFFFF